MSQLNENYSNSTNIAVLSTSAHETSEVKVYEHPLFGKVRMFVRNGKTWFCGIDIATSLKYVNPSKAILDHCKSAYITIREVGVQTGVKSDGTPAIQTKDMKFISEGNIYRLTAKSQMPKADEFESWIFDEIVPSVVNTGSYSVQPQYQIPQSFSEALMLAANQAKQIEEQQKQIEQKEEKITELTAENEELQKQSEYTRVILQNKGTTLVTQIAQDYGMSAMKFNAMLRNYGIQYKMRNQWILYAKYLDKGYVQSSTHNFTHKNGRPDVSLTTEWTQRGRLFLYNFLKGKGVLPLIELR